jgi:tRNA A-37 threonylcarbamoyl transferase component Bud32
VTNFTYSIVTEFIDGKNLKQLVKENVEFSEELALNIM